MKPRERLMRALHHKEPDRVPIDIGTAVTSIHMEAYMRLKKYLGLGRTTPQILDRMQQVPEVEEPVLRRFKADTRHIRLRAQRDWVRLSNGNFVDEWGIKYTKPISSHYYDIYEHPLAQAMVEDLDRYEWPDPTHSRRLEGLKEKARRLREDTDYAVGLEGFSGGLFALPSWLRGHAQFYTDLALDSQFANLLLDRLLDYEIKLAKHVLDQIGSFVDIVRVSDDLGMENGLIISPDLYRKMIKPRQKKLYKVIKENSDAKVLLHSCGSIYKLIPDFIEIGMDALNPVQVSTKDMEDTAKLKREFGDRITFWGGGCDTQRVLPFRTPEEVREEVKRRIKDLAPGGGFVFAPVHNIQPDASPEKICALYDTALGFGKYPIE
jgi:uroporphyrinogen decarboxylase